MPKSDVPDFLLDAHADLQSGRWTSVELTTALLQRIERYDEALKSYAAIFPETALAEAHAADAALSEGRCKGPLHGIPLAIKDLIWTKGEPTTFGMTILSDWRPSEDATLLERLRSAGAVILGKHRLSEGATVSHHPELPAPVNPWNAAHATGVSSSGSGVAVAASLCFGAIGSDTAGSIRYPSSMNGITGVKPTWGRVSRHGVVPLIPYQDTVGPMARSAADAAAILGEIAGPDPRDSTAAHTPVPDYLGSIDEGVASRRIGICAPHIADHPAVLDAVERVAGVLEGAGAHLVQIKFPDTAIETLLPLLDTGVAESNIGRYPEQASKFGPDLAAMIESGRSRIGMEIVTAMNAADRLKGTLAAIFDKVDMILAPAIPMLPWPLGTWEEAFRAGDPSALWLFRYTLPFNITHNPTVTFPAGSENGLPIGVQVIGRHFDEALLLRAAHSFQLQTNWHRLRPDLAR